MDADRTLTLPLDVVINSNGLSIDAGEPSLSTLSQCWPKSVSLLGIETGIETFFEFFSQGLVYEAILTFPSVVHPLS